MELAASALELGRCRPAVASRLDDLGAPPAGRGDEHAAHELTAVVAEEHVLGATQTDPLRTERACLRRVSAVSAFALTPRRRSSSDQRRTSSKCSLSSGSTSGTSSAVTLPVVPSIAIRSPSASCRSPIVTVAASSVDLDLGGAGDAGAAHAAGDQRCVRGLAALGGENPAGSVKPGDVVGFGERADQDHIVAVGRAAHGLGRR